LTAGADGAVPARTGVAVISHDSIDDLRRFLAGQLEAAAEASMPLVAVDNASADGSAEYLREALGAGDVVVNTSNRGYAAAVNQAFAALPDRHVLILNPDVEVDGGNSLTRLAAALEERPRAGAVGPRLLNQDGTTQSSARRFPSPLAMAGNSSAAGRAAPARRAADRYLRPPRADRATRVDWLLGAAMLVRREAYEEVGGWDERYFLYLEDTDFCRRLGQRGWECWYLPQVAMRHVHARASAPGHGGALLSRARRAHIRSAIRFYARYPELIGGRHLRGE
jgi:N-acetylglucosaminyl-diphospho-decaprenol L-rhamnosyltransferase